MLAIAGGKGGSGKTTTTLGVAAALEGSTLVVDADIDMPNLHALAAVDREPTLGDLAEDSDGVAQSHPEYDDVSVLPAPRTEDAADLTASLARLSGDETVLVDCPGGAGPDAVAPLRAADDAVVVSSACGPALRDAAKTAEMARAVGAEVVGAVLTRTRLAPEGVSQLLGCPILGTIPTADPPILGSRSVRRAYDAVAESLYMEVDLLSNSSE